MAAGFWTDARRGAALDAALAGGTHAMGHTGVPGTSGTANAVASMARFPVSKSATVAGAATITGLATVPGAATITHVSLWTASTGGTFLGWRALDSSAVFSGAGTGSLSWQESVVTNS